MLSGILLLLAGGCDREGGYYVAVPNADYPFIQDLGEFRVVSVDEQAAAFNADDTFVAYDPALLERDDQGRAGVWYGGLGAPEDPSYYGGATFTFKGTGGSVCVVVDPEAVFWNQAQSPSADTSDYLYVDNTADDGDIDLDVGLSAYYSGSPGVEMGDFELIYTDDGGVDHSLSYSQCSQSGSVSISGAHSGRSTVEYCTVNTSGLEGVAFTGVLNTFLLPLTDDVVHYAAGVFEGNCTSLVAAPKGIDECFMAREEAGARDIPDEEATEEYCNDPDNEWNYACLENKFCGTVKKFNAYCEDHFDDADAPCIDNGVHPPVDDAEADPGATGP
jgi:hypothetical protein